jgi:hypothetical protein
LSAGGAARLGCFVQQKGQGLFVEFCHALKVAQ